MNPQTLALSLVRASIEGGVLILVVAALTRLVPRMPAAARCALWWLACVRLLLGLVLPPVLPVVLPSLHSVKALPGSVTASVPVARLDQASRVVYPPIPTAAQVSTTTTATTATQEPATPLRLDAIGLAGLALLALWIGGALTVLLLHARDARRLGRIWRAATPVDSSQVRGWLGEWIEDATAGRIELRASAEPGSPLVMGPLSTRILIPSTCLALDPARLRMALAHEVSHVRRRDLWWGWVPALAECVFWFHPLAHWAVHEYAQAREEACDAEALRLSESSPDRYGELLLGFGVDGARRVHAATSCGSSHVRQLQRRLHMLAHAVGASRAHRALAIGALVVIGAVALVPVRFVTASEKRSSSRSSAKSEGTTTNSHTTTRDGKLVYSVTTSRPAGEKKSSTYAWSSGLDKKGGGAFAFGILRGDHQSLSGNFGGGTDWKWIERLQEEEKGEVGWFLIDGDGWVVRDPDDIEAMEETIRPQTLLGEQQSKLGDQQSRLGDLQSKLGDKQSELGDRQADLGDKQADISDRMSNTTDRGRLAELRRLQDELDEKMDELNQRQTELSREQTKLGAQQSELGQLQSELGRRQEEVTAKSRREMESLARSLIREHRAVRVQR